jgi:hypothetical protein
MNTTPTGVNSADIRKWAIENGYPDLAGKNGRLPSRAIQSYVTAHGLTDPATTEGP